MAKHELTTDLKYNRSRKAWNAGMAGVGVAFGSVSVAGLFNEHGINAAAVGVAAGAVVTGFVAGFLAAFLSPNETD